VIITVGNHLRDYNSKCRHYIEIEDKRLAVTRQRDLAVRRALYFRETETQRFHIAAEIDRSGHLGAEQVVIHLGQGGNRRARSGAPGTETRPRRLVTIEQGKVI
jgi:hypothetical protein